MYIMPKDFMRSVLGTHSIVLSTNLTEKIVLFAGGPLVKFSLDNDLESEDCLRLLDLYMPADVKAHKITQTMFIR